MGSICVFGASSTWGCWDLEKGGWVNRLRLFIDANNCDGSASSPQDAKVYNLGISGNTTNDLKSFAK